jgi:hypothetical protein
MVGPNLAIGYFYKPELRGERLTPQQMATPDGVGPIGGGGAPILHQQMMAMTATMQPEGVVAAGQPAVGAADPAHYAQMYGSKPDGSSYTQALLVSPAGAIPGFGLQV